MTRLSALPRLAAAALAAGLVLGAAPAAEARRAPSRAAAAPAVAVDVSVLRQKGLGATAELLGSAVLDELRRQGVQPQPGTRLVVRLTGYSSRIFTGPQDTAGGGGFGGGATNNDYLQGENIVVGPNGEFVRSFPILLALPASYGGAWYLPGNDERRVVGIARTYAQWVKRDLS